MPVGSEDEIRYNSNHHSIREVLKKMGKKIVTTGRGGAGKTTFAALAVRFLVPPLLLIDIDPDQSLGEMLGIDLEKEGVRTVLDVLFDIQKRRGYENISSMAVPDKIKFLFNSECLYESRHFDLITLGIKWTQGCYCSPNNLLREMIPSLAENYAHVIIDAPAGLEHLNRRVASEIDDMFLVMDPSLKSLKNIGRIQKLTKETGISYEKYYLIANYRFTPEMEKRIPTDQGQYLGNIAYDDIVEEYNLAGRSLLELPENSPASASVMRILKNAGYRLKSSG